MMEDRQINLANRLLINSTNAWQRDITRLQRRRVRNGGPEFYSEDDKKTLFTEWKTNNCEKSKNELINSSLPLVLKYSRQLVNQYGNHNIAIEDFEQQGNLALLDALDNYDPQKGNFSTYIRVYLPKYFFPFTKKYSKIIREPDSVIRKKKEAARVASYFYTREGRDPEEGEVTTIKKDILSFKYEPEVQVVSGDDFAYGDECTVTLFDTIIEEQECSELNLDWLSDIINQKQECGLTKIQHEIIHLRFVLNSEISEICQVLEIDKKRYRREYNTLLSVLRYTYLKQKDE